MPSTANEEVSGRSRSDATPHDTMRAIVVEAPGGPEVLQIQARPRPTPRDGWVLLQVKAFGLNRSEVYTRRGESPSVQFPRVLGIECVGVVVAAPGTSLVAGQTVAALLGGMGRAFDGGYAEYTLVPATHVTPITTALDWEQLAALPETYLTAWGSFTVAMGVSSGQRLLVRGATSSVGMAALALARDIGLTVLATTRNPAKVQGLRDAGAAQVVLDSGEIAHLVREFWPDGADQVLELVGPRTLKDSLRAAARGGVVCVTGLLGDTWVMDAFEPLGTIPTGVKLTVYSSSTMPAVEAAVLQGLVDGVAAGRYTANVDRVFTFDQIAEAHRYMEGNRAMGKLVVRVA